MFLLVAIALRGAASATTELEIESDYQDMDGNDIDNAELGEAVQYTAETENEGNDNAYDVTVSVNIDSDIDWDNSQFTYTTSYDDGNTWNQFDDNVTSTDKGFDWNIGTLVPDQEAIFKADGMVPVSTGSETATATVYENSAVQDESTSTLDITQNKPVKKSHSFR
jgi:uncharacterized repeat protein (TIGR01451 family)